MVFGLGTLCQEEDFGGHSILICLGAALRERLQYLISLIEGFLANGGRRRGFIFGGRQNSIRGW